MQCSRNFSRSNLFVPPLRTFGEQFVPPGIAHCPSLIQHRKPPIVVLVGWDGTDQYMEEGCVGVHHLEQFNNDRSNLSRLAFLSEETEMRFPFLLYATDYIIRYRFSEDARRRF